MPFFDGLKNIKLSLLTDFVEISAAEQFAVKSELSLLNMKTFFDWDVQGETIPPWEIANALKAEMRGRKKGNFISIFAITNPPVLRDAGTEQGLQILPASTAVHTTAASDVRV